jgi:uncharacterized membrane protein
VSFVLGLVLTLSVSGPAWAETHEPEQVFLKARVLDVVEVESGPESTPTGFVQSVDMVTVQVLGGEFSGEVVTVTQFHTGQTAYDIKVDKGDTVLLWAEVHGGTLVEVQIADYVRESQLLLVSAAFILLVLVIGGLKGLKSVISLAVTGSGSVRSCSPCCWQVTTRFSSRS